MIEVLFYIAGVVTIVVLFTLWCIVSIERVRKEREISAYAALCGRIQEQINETSVTFDKSNKRGACPRYFSNY